MGSEEPHCVQIIKPSTLFNYHHEEKHIKEFIINIKLSFFNNVETKLGINSGI